MKNKQTIRSLNEMFESFSSLFDKNKKQLIGLEHEKALFDCSQEQPKRISPEQVADIFATYEGRGWQWKPSSEFTHHVELVKNDEYLSLESGGQIEYSGRPCSNIHETNDLLMQDIDELKSITRDRNIILSCLGFDPISKTDQIREINKERFDHLYNYYKDTDTFFRKEMCGTSSIQCSLDYQDAEDLNKKFTVATTFQSILSTLFASSPLCEGKRTEHQSVRNYIWSQVVPSRYGLCHATRNPQSWESYLDYFVKQPVAFVLRDKKYYPCSGETFIDFMNGKLKCLPNEFPDLEDLLFHMGTLYPDARIKRVLELREADACPTDLLLAWPAIWVGLLYDKNILDEAYKMACKVPLEILMDWKQKSHTEGLKLSYQNKPITHLLRELIEMAEEGLNKRNIKNYQNQNEAIYIESAKDVLTNKRTTSDLIILDMNKMQMYDIIMKWSY